jgi:hypothetical protein
LAVLVAILLGAFVLRLWDVGQPSIWHDEGWSIRAIRDPVHTPDDKTPVAYYALAHVLWRGAGDSPLALRYGSVLLDVITVALAARVMRRWAGWEAGALAALLLTLSPLLWAYAREIRAYVAVPLLAVLILALAERLLSNPRAWRVWAGLLAAELLLLYTHNLGVTVVAWLNLVVGSVWLAGRQWRRLPLWGAGQGALLLAYLPWLLGQAPSGTPLNTPPRLSPELAWDIWRGYFAPLPAMIGAETAVEIGSAVLGAAMLLAVAATLLWNRRRYALLLLSQAVLLPLLATVMLHAASIDFHPRYYVAGVPATLMLVVAAAHSLPVHAEVRRLAGAGVLALAAGAGAASFIALFKDPAYQRDDFRAVAAHYAALPAGALIVIPYGWEPALDVYYADRLGIAAQFVGVDLHSSAEQAMRAINEALAARDGPVHVELLTWFQLPADLRGMFPCLLESAGERGETFTVQGISTSAYTIARPLALGASVSRQDSFGALDLVSAAHGGEQTVCLRTEWALPAETGEDWRVAARLLTSDPPGWVLARSDSDIRSDEQAPTSLWAAGARGEAFSLLRFPAGAPPGDYVLQTILFSADHPDGLDRLVNGVPAGKALALATVAPPERARALPPGAGPALATLAAGVALVGHDARGGALAAGQELRVTLRWGAMSDCCAAGPWTGATLALRGEGWGVAGPVRVHPGYSLDWHALLVPAEAEGRAALVLEAPGQQPVTLAEYTVERTERLFAPPPYDTALLTGFQGVAVLEGFSAAQTEISPDETLGLTLVWRVTETPGVSYRVFTHLLNDAGRVIAQHDGIPGQGARPTTSWVAGEYLADSYALVFNDEGRAYRGPARLEVGFYDPQTGARVLTAGGADHVLLPVEIMVR